MDARSYFWAVDGKALVLRVPSNVIWTATSGELIYHSLLDRLLETRPPLDPSNHLESFRLD